MNGVALYLRLVGLSVRAQMQYKNSFLFTALGHFFTTGVEAVGLWALFDRFGSLTAWTLPQVAFFYGVVNMAFACADALARGFDLFGSELIKTGNFDQLLLRPRGTVLQVAGREFTLFRVGRFLQGALVLGWAITHLDIDWTLWRVLLLLFSLSATVLFFYALVIFQATLSFWTTESLEIMNTLTYGGVYTAQHPLAIYERSFQRFFIFVIPLGCVSYFPIVAILGVPDPIGSPLWAQMLSPLAGFLFFALSLAAWRLGVRHYTSTGS